MQPGGRLFTANDLRQAKIRRVVKKRKDSPEENRHGSASNSDIAGLFANAIELRMRWIREASDSEESEFEDIDDDDWDD